MPVSPFEPSFNESGSREILLEIGKDGYVEWMNEDSKACFGELKGKPFSILEDRYPDYFRKEMVESAIASERPFRNSLNDSRQISYIPVHSKDNKVERVVISIDRRRLEKTKFQTDRLRREIDLINNLSKFMWHKEYSISSLMKFLTNEIPKAMNYPELVSIRIEWMGKEFLSQGFHETQLFENYPISSEDNRFGSLTIFYDKVPGVDSSELFDDGEKSVLFSVVERVGKIIDRIETSRTFIKTLESIGDGVISTDTEGKIMFMNDVAARITGSNRFKAVGLNINNILTLFDSESGEKISFDTRDLLSGKAGPSFPPNASVISPEGKIRLLADSASVIEDDERDIIGIVYTFRDVTEERNTLDKLAENEARFRLLLDNMQMGVIVCFADNNGNRFMIGDINKAAEKFEGVKREDALGSEFTQVFPSLASSGFSKVLKKVHSTGNPVYIPAARYKDGHRVGWKRASVYKLPSGEIVCLYDDITEERRYQAELELQSQILNEVDKAIIAADSERKITYLNKAAENLFGWKAVEVLGRKANEVLIPVEEENTLNEVMAFLNADGIWKGEILFRRKNGEKFTAEVTNLEVKLTESGSKGYVSVSSDITERKLTEKALKNTLNSTIGLLSAIAESKNPFSVGHQKNVSRLASEIAKRMGLSERRVELISLAGMVLDIGMIAVPSEILLKSRPLNDIERSLMMQHVEKGKDILEKAEFFSPIVEQVYQHHERLDGSGYPNGLKGDQIVLEARILAVADVFEAMMSHRAHRPALGIAEALSELKKNGGILYDRDVVSACVQIIESGFTFESN